MTQQLLFSLFFIPLFGAIWLLMAGKSSNNWAGFFTASLLSIGLIDVLFLLFSKGIISYENSWLSWHEASFMVSYWLTPMVRLMLLLVFGIGTCVVAFSVTYMQTDENRFRYFAFILLFIAAMVGIVVSKNLFQLYFFWEWVGLCSYLLIGFWHEKPVAVRAAKKAFLMNRAGDLGLLLGIFGVYTHIGTTDLEVIGQATTPVSTTIGLLLFCGCVAKSAQFPLRSWLPDAMAGPTPASALIHAATMVAAGIFLMVNVLPILSHITLQIVAVIGTISAISGAISAIFQHDFKKILAYSTISQLGLMVTAVGLGLSQQAMFHLFTHGFFKAGLFLSAGAIIHAVHGQDIRNTGNLFKAMPVVFCCVVLNLMALVGIPFTSGLASKSLILAGAFAQASSLYSWLIFAGIYISIFLTGLYSFRLFWFLLGKSNSEKLTKKQILSVRLSIPLLVLSIFSVGVITTFIAKNFLLLPQKHSLNSQVIEYSAVILGIIVGYALFAVQKKQVSELSFGVFGDHWFEQTLPVIKKVADFFFQFDKQIIDKSIDTIIVIKVALAHTLAWFDNHIIDGIVSLLVCLLGKIGKATRSIQSGNIQWQMFATWAGFFALVIISIYFSGN